MWSKSDILLVGQTPPPYHGQAVVTAMLFDHQWRSLCVRKLRMDYSEDIYSVGKFSFRKVLKLFTLIVNTWIVLLFHRPTALYYLPASPNMVPVLRDIVYLSCVRMFFRKTLFHFHADGLYEFIEDRGLVLRSIARHSYSGADIQINVSEFVAATGGCFPAAKYEVVKNGVEAQLMEARSDSERITILYLGLLSKEKGLLELMEATAILAISGVAFRVLVVGLWACDNFRDVVHFFVRQEGLEEYVEFLGPVVGERKWSLYSGADVFCFPSHHPTETFGMVLAEAMACSLPVVATRWRATPEVVIEGETALLYEKGNVALLAASLEKLVKDPELRERMGRAGRARYEAEFTKEKFLERMENVFEEVVRS